MKTGTFVCFDCEATGLDVEKDRIIEVAAIVFTFDGEIASFETLVDPEMAIPPESTKIHNITDDMVKGKPKIGEVLPALLALVEKHPVVGHSIGYDIDLVKEECKRCNITTSLGQKPIVDTLRLARLYGETPVNSLQKLREHFNIPMDIAHRAMGDVLVNISVFKYLSKQFTTLEKLLERMKKPIPLKVMPLGKHRGRPFNEIPVQYLSWAARQDFDDDLIFSLRSELKKRNQGNRFSSSANPFADL
ncbi:MAG: DUF3820 family protein [Simkaniaceae bacterium]|nr:DUF3820 family protein [Simkaniaceae bacterium]